MLKATSSQNWSCKQGSPSGKSNGADRDLWRLIFWARDVSEEEGKQMKMTKVEQVGSQKCVSSWVISWS